MNPCAYFHKHEIQVLYVDLHRSAPSYNIFNPRTPDINEACHLSPEAMSDQRLAWTDDEKKLLESTRRELPGATVKELTQVFNMSNHQFRTEVAVRQTLGRLGLSRQPRRLYRVSYYV